jgi:two-component system, cell cycle sensor histidine kinase and response regulator CckA
MQVADAYVGPIDLILTDVIMPGISGPNAVEQIAPTRPRMKVLYISGYSKAAVLRQGMIAPRTAFLGKPFTPDTLLRKMRELLDGA